MDELSQEQKDLIIKEWNSRPDNPPSLIELTRLVFPDKKVDGRCKEGKMVQAFLASRSLKARGTHEYKPKDEITLTEEQKLYIQNNFKTMKSLEMAKELFQNSNLSNLSQETRTIMAYVKEIDVGEKQESFDDEGSEEYRSPKSLDKLIYKINRHIFDLELKKETLTTKQKKDLTALLKYINTYRFTHQINLYISKDDRDLFESSFIRYTYDKNDLTEEEVDQYIVLSTEVVISATIQKTITNIEEQIKTEYDNNDKVPMALVEMLTQVRTEYNQCVNRQQKLLGDLKEKRADRLSKEGKHTASIATLFQMVKEEESRRNLVALAEKRKKSTKDEVDKLSSMDELKFKLLGISTEEILNG